MHSEGNELKINKILLAGLASVMFFVGMAQVTHADGLNFTVETAIPNNQIGDERSYYNLLIQPDQQQTLQVKLVNKTAKPVNVAASTHTAITNENGVVDYANKTQKHDKSMQFSMQDYVTMPKQVTIAAHAEVIVPVKVHMPAGKLKGVMVGGLVFKQVSDEDAQSQSGMTIVNQFAYTVVLMMRQSTKIIAPDLKLSNVTVTQLNLHNALNLNLRNPQPGFLNHLTLESKITKRGSDKVVYTSNAKDLQMAPNTKFAFPVRLGTGKFVAGDYTAHIVAYALPAKDGQYTDASGQRFTRKWDFDKDFTIERDTAEKLNKRAVKESTWAWWVIALIIAASLLLVGFVVVLVLLLRSKKQAR